MLTLKVLNGNIKYYYLLLFRGHFWIQEFKSNKINGRNGWKFSNRYYVIEWLLQSVQHVPNQFFVFFFLVYEMYAFKLQSTNFMLVNNANSWYYHYYDCWCSCWQTISSTIVNYQTTTNYVECWKFAWFQNRS